MRTNSAASSSQLPAARRCAIAGVAAGRRGGFGLVVGVDRVGQGDRLAEAGAGVVLPDLDQLHPDPHAHRDDEGER